MAPNKSLQRHGFPGRLNSIDSLKVKAMILATCSSSSPTVAQTPTVTPVRTRRFGWHQLSYDFAEDSTLGLFRERIGGLFGQRANEDSLRLELTGSLGVEAAGQLEQSLESLQARLLRMKLTNKVVVAPTADEIQALTQRPSDPLTARVASQLVARAAGTDETSAPARIALRELYAACNQH